tara:strand:+ start:2386 stop:2649 length:264 start_codon:yes stop_codon:yes gene_type:complete
MENQMRKFIISSETFSDYDMYISLYDISTIDDIINIMRNDLIEKLSALKLTNLVKKINNTNFHIHSYTIEDILVSKSEEIFYICDHT